jgi:hypothetical protein
LGNSIDIRISLGVGIIIIGAGTYYFRTRTPFGSQTSETIIVEQTINNDSSLLNESIITVEQIGENTSNNSEFPIPQPGEDPNNKKKVIFYGSLKNLLNGGFIAHIEKLTRLAKILKLPKIIIILEKILKKK